MAQDAERLIVLLEARIRDFERNMQKAGGTADRNYGRMRRNSRSATRQMEQDMVRSTSRINQALASTSTQIGALGRTFIGGFAGGMFATGLAGLQRGVRDLISEMSNMANVSKMVGIATDDLQRLRYAFEQTGVSADQTDTAMRRFARRIGEAANGGGVLHDVLKANNVQLRNADGSMRSQMELLRVYANLIKNAGSHQERLALAFKAFDIAGADMVQLLANGADGLDTFMDKAEETGGIIEDELVQKAAELDTQFNDLWRNFELWAKRAIINVSVALRDGLLKDINDIGSALRDLINDPSFHSAGRVLFGDDFMGDENVNRVAGIERRIKMLTDQVENLKDLGFDAVEAERELALARAELEAEVQRIMAGGGETTLPTIEVSEDPTIIPGGGNGSGADEKALERQREMLQRRLEQLRQFIISEAEMTAFAQQLEIEQAQEHHEKRLEDLNASLEARLITRERYNEMVAALEEQHENELTLIKQDHLDRRSQAEQDYLRFREQAANQLVGLLGMMGQKSRTAAIAAIALNKALMIAQTIQNTAAAAAAALAPPPLGLGPVAGAGLAARTKAFGAIQVAAIAGTGLMQAANTGGGSAPSASDGGGVSSSAGGAIGNQYSGPRQAMTVNIEGDYVSKQSVHDLIDEINEAQRDGYTIIHVGS